MKRSRTWHFSVIVWEAWNHWIFLSRAIFTSCREEKHSLSRRMFFILALVVGALTIWPCQAASAIFYLNSTIEERQIRLNDSFQSWQSLLLTKGTAYCYSNDGLDLATGLSWTKTFFVEGGAVVRVELDYSNGTIHETFPSQAENVTLSSWYSKCQEFSRVDQMNASAFVLSISMPDNILERCLYTSLNGSVPFGAQKRFPTFFFSSTIPLLLAILLIFLPGLGQTAIHFGPCPTRRSWLVPFVAVAVAVSIISIFVTILVTVTYKKKVDKDITEFD